MKPDLLHQGKFRTRVWQDPDGRWQYRVEAIGWRGSKPRPLGDDREDPIEEAGEALNKVCMSHEYMSHRYEVGDYYDRIGFMHLRSKKRPEVLAQQRARRIVELACAVLERKKQHGKSEESAIVRDYDCVGGET